MDEHAPVTGVGLRPLSRDDEAAVAALLGATFADKTAAMIPGDPGLAAAVMAGLAYHSRGWVAYAGNEVVGLLLLWENDGVRRAKADWPSVRRRLPLRAALHAWLFLLAFYWIRFPADVLLIDTLAVFPARQNGGIGRLLLDRGVGEARRLGRRAVRLYCLPSNERAHAFYERYGFRVLRRERYRLSGRLLGFDRSDLMELTLVSEARETPPGQPRTPTSFSKNSVTRSGRIPARS